MSYRAKKVSEILSMMEKQESIRNIALVGHIDHGKTTLSDSLLAEAGLLSPQLAGEARVLDYLDEEQRRGITMKSANISLYYEKSIGDPFLINLVDTPGHLDFSGKVTRALRLVDGVIVIVDAVEEISSQSETVVRQALNEGVKPILFINKIDRLINELKLEPLEIQEKLSRIIDAFNDLIDIFADPPYSKDWQVDPAKGNVLFGSALHRWGFSLPEILARKMKFEDIVKKYWEGTQEDLQTIFPVWEAVLHAVATFIPNPRVAQAYRIKKIWDGDLETRPGLALQACDASEEAPLIICFSKVEIEKHAIVATGRVFSGRLKRGTQLHLMNAGVQEKIQQVSIYMGARRDQVDEIPAGNIAAITGLKEVKSGETLATPAVLSDMVPFEEVKYVSDPVMTVAIEPEQLRYLNRLQDMLKEVLIEDPNLSLRVSEETGEVLLSGMGPLHLEVTAKQIQERGLKITTSKPIPVFRESIDGASPLIKEVSTNGKNRVKLALERVETPVVEVYQGGKYSLGMVKPDLLVKLLENSDIPSKHYENLVYVDHNFNSVFFLMEKEKRATIHPQLIEKVCENIAAICREGPLCKENLRELKILVKDLDLAEHGEERTDGDLSPMFRKAIFDAIKATNPVLLEPIYRMEVFLPPEYLGNVTSMVSQLQGKVLEIRQQSEQRQYIQVQLLIAVRVSIEFVEELRSTTSGRAFWQYQFDSFQNVPSSLQHRLVKEINIRKGALVEEDFEEIALGDIDFDEE